MSAVEIICSNCGAETLLKREAVYDGFTKTGEKLACSSCGHEYASEAEVPFKKSSSAPQIFTDADKSAEYPGNPGALDHTSTCEEENIADDT